MNPPPLPFGDPTQVRQENASAVGKGVFFGCGGCALIVLASFAFVATIFAIVLGSVKHSDVSKEAFARAQASGEVRAVLGTPMEQSWSFSGSISTNNGVGDASITFAISGPKGSGVLHAEATKQSGVWTFHKLRFTSDKNGRTIDLLAPANVT